MPKMAEGSGPTTRLIEVLDAEGWLNCVTLPAGTENDCQLIAEWFVPAPFCVVTTSLLPCWFRFAVPCVACAPAGCASAGREIKAAATARAVAAGRNPATAGLDATGRRERGRAGFRMVTFCWTDYLTPR